MINCFFWNDFVKRSCILIGSWATYFLYRHNSGDGVTTQKR